MTNPKERRIMLVRTIPIEGTPDFYENLKAEFLDQFKNRLGFHLNLMHNIHESIHIKAKDLNEVNKDNKELKQQANLNFNISHQKIDRGALIEGVIFFDHSIDEALYHFHIRKLNKKSEEIKKWWKVEEKLNEYLRDLNLPKQFQSQRLVLKNFRKLRNQFAHNPIGIFSFEVNEENENFESFLETLDGINLEDSLHVTISGKAGAMVPYNLISGKFLEKFFDESIVFFSMLLEILFPTEIKKVFNFKK